MEMTKEVTQLFLNGGKVVADATHTCNSYLIRMPKGAFIEDDREEFDNHYFEYVIIEDLSPNNILTTATYLNNTLGGAKKTLYKNHEERCSLIYRKQMNKNK